MRIYELQINDFFSTTEWENIQKAADKLPTPFILINKEKVRQNFRELSRCFNYGKIYYAMKANPSTEILKLLKDEDSYFDCASKYEIEDLFSIGVKPERISFGNTIKKIEAIKFAYANGIREYVTDSELDLQNIAKYAPGSNINFRILVEGSLTAEWPLSRKFGCNPDVAYDLIIEAKKLGLNPKGISFHVGSQQHDIGVWNSAISKVKQIFDQIAQESDITLNRINLGGGFPATYRSRVNNIELYASEIKRFLDDYFGESTPEIWLEPGRGLVGDSGILVSEVILISRKSKTALNRWIYQDSGKFNGLIETLDECIKYPIFTSKENFPKEEAILAGPTCDSMDIMYENILFPLPKNLEVGDKLFWISTGAYTSSYASIRFNGFPPLETYMIDDFSTESFNKLIIERGLS